MRDKMLLIDGVRYELWTPPSEEEFERVVKEHTQEIFGEQSIYLDRKQKLSSLSGIGSIPDGYAIVFRGTPEWHIVEVELSSHPLHEHIVSQVSRFITGISNPNTQREIARAIYAEITGDSFIKLKVEQATRATEIYKFLSDLIAEQPILTIIIEKDTAGLREAISTLAHSQIKTVEFQTFTREGLGLEVHAHLFEPLYKPATPGVPYKPRDEKVREPTTTELEHALTERDLKMERFRIPAKHKWFFPPPLVEFELMIGQDIVRTNGRGRGYPLFIQKNLKKWFRAHRELEVGDKVVFKVIEPMKKYRLEILK